jgi:phosphoglycolate phosphatase
MLRRTIVFDLDGTLIDTAPDLIAALNVVFEREGIAAVEYAEARLAIGGGAKAMIARALAATGRDVLPARLEKMFKDFIAHYSAHISDSSRPFPGLEDVLNRLSGDGFGLAVCTNKLEALSRQLLHALGLAERFAAICGQDTFGVQKPDPIVLHRTIEAAGGAVETAIMIGDSATDVLTARAAGVPIIGVDFGYTERPIAEFRPDCVISKFAELPDAIARIGRAN